MKLSRFITAVLVAGALLATLCVPGGVGAAENPPIQVSAAISLKEALTRLKDIYTARNPGSAVQYNFGSSGMLQKQIEEGAPVDLFISAGQKQMDELSAKGLLLPESRSNLLGNELVLITAREKKNAIRTFADLAGRAKSISIGQPETVPAGKYAKESLASLKLWDRVEKKIVFAKDVRQVLAYVESGNVDVGIVYRSDTAALKTGQVAAAAPKNSHSAILYPMAIVKGSKNRNAAGKFMSFLKSPEAAKVFSEYRFIPLKK